MYLKMCVWWKDHWLRLKKRRRTLKYIFVGIHLSLNFILCLRVVETMSPYQVVEKEFFNKDFTSDEHRNLWRVRVYISFGNIFDWFRMHHQYMFAFLHEFLQPLHAQSVRHAWSGIYCVGYRNILLTMFWATQIRFHVCANAPFAIISFW